MTTTYTYWRYRQKYEAERGGTPEQVLLEAIDDIENDIAHPENISVDGHTIYDEVAIQEAYLNRNMRQQKWQ